jgi:hypothetical protein
MTQRFLSGESTVFIIVLVFLILSTQQVKYTETGHIEKENTDCLYEMLWYVMPKKFSSDVSKIGILHTHKSY